MMRWNDIFQLPEAALTGGRRIPKTMLVAQAKLTRHEQKTLSKVKQVDYFANVSKSTSYILPCVDGDRNIQSIVFLIVEMAGSLAFSEVAQLLHKCFPNPTVLLFEAGGKAAVSASITRASHAEAGATVVEAVEATGVFDPADERYGALFDALAFENLAQDDLWAYLRSLAWNLRLSRVIGDLGFFPSCPVAKRDEMLELMRRYDAATATAKGLQEQRAHGDVSLNESARLRMRMKALEKERNALVAEIKELCHDGD